MSVYLTQQGGGVLSPGAARACTEPLSQSHWQAGCIPVRGGKSGWRFKDAGIQYISKMICSELICLPVSVQVMSKKHFHFQKDAF